MRTIKAARIELEPQVVSHAEEMFEVLSDPAIYEYENEPPRSLEWLRERFRKLETRRSADGTQRWLNWVIRVPGSGLIGYVQATVYPDGRAAIAYELASRHWGRGFASEAVRAMSEGLSTDYGVGRLTAVFKQANHRSQRLLERLGFSAASAALHTELAVPPDERLMVKELV
jgi:RimJ/RimL family protein N-acetyltransferase